MGIPGGLLGALVGFLGTRFLGLLLDKQIISSATFTALLLMAVGSTMLTTPMVSPKLKRMKFHK